LISNASDALEKARYLSSTNNNRLRDPEVPLEIRVVTDAKNNQIIIQDTGIGMNKEELISHLGTIARSGSKAFVKELNSKGESSNTNIIGQFGVGFYSSFMVGEKVEVISQTANPDGSPVSHVWTSDG
jgi:TNF receptor-associated protein 1